MIHNVFYVVNFVDNFFEYFYYLLMINYTNDKF